MMNKSFKAILIPFLLLFSISCAYADIRLIVDQRGTEGKKVLSNKMLFVQIDDASHSIHFNRATDEYGIFSIGDQYKQATVRVYLRDDRSGSILAGCFSDFVPAIPNEVGKITEVSLKGIDCL